MSRRHTSGRPRVSQISLVQLGLLVERRHAQSVARSAFFLDTTVGHQRCARRSTIIKFAIRIQKPSAIATDPGWRLPGCKAGADLDVASQRSRAWLQGCQAAGSKLQGYRLQRCKQQVAHCKAASSRLHAARLQTAGSKLQGCKPQSCKAKSLLTLPARLHLRRGENVVLLQVGARYTFRPPRGSLPPPDPPHPEPGADGSRQPPRDEGRRIPAADSTPLLGDVGRLVSHLRC